MKIGDHSERSGSYRLGNLLVVLHWCASLTIILSGFTFIPARINGDFNEYVFPAWALTQIVVIAILCFIPQITVIRRKSMANWASPLRMCVLFLLGMAWYLGAEVILPQDGNFWLIGVIPSAICLSIASVMGFLFVIDYCRATSEEGFWKHAAPGAIIAAFLVFFPISIFPLASTVMCCIVAVAWYIARRHLSASLTEYETALPDDAHDRRRMPAVMASTAALFFAGGMICPLVVNPTSLLSAHYTELYVLSFIALVIALTCIPALGYLHGVYAHVKICVLVSGFAYCFQVLMGNALVGIAAAVLLGSFAVNASMMLYVLSQFIGDPRVFTMRFWGCVTLIFLAFFAGIAIASISIHSSGDAEIEPFVAFSLCSYMVFVIFFRESWTFHKPESLDVKRIAVTPILENSPEEELYSRCHTIAYDYKLTEREAEVLLCLGEGWSVPAVARRLMISQDTTRTHVKHIYTKLDIHSRDELVKIIKNPDK